MLKHIFRDISDNLKIIKATVMRDLRIDFKYKFQLIIDAALLAIDIFAFYIVGTYVIGSIKSKTEFDTSDNPAKWGSYLRDFFFVGVIFWALFTSPYEETVKTVPEEASKGTLGFLVSNNVSVTTLLISQMISSFIKTVVVVFGIVFPILTAVGMPLPPIKYIFHLIVIIIFIWLFVLSMGYIMSSIAIIFKRNWNLSLMFLYFLKIISGYYFPIETMPNFFEFFATKLPVTAGLSLFRDFFILGHPVNLYSRMFIVIFGSLLSYIASYALLKYCIKKSSRLGTLEHY